MAEEVLSYALTEIHGVIDIDIRSTVPYLCPAYSKSICRSAMYVVYSTSNVVA